LKSIGPEGKARGRFGEDHAPNDDESKVGLLLRMKMAEIHAEMGVFLDFLVERWGEDLEIRELG
jgi:hypothetical protein